MNDTLDTVQQIFVDYLNQTVEKENISKEILSNKITHAAVYHNRLSLIDQGGIKNFDNWLQVNGFHRENWITEYKQALKELFYIG